MLRKLLQTEDDAAALVSRLALGIVIFPHGAQKLLGWFGGGGFSATVGFFTERMGLPAVVAVLIILAESLGALSLILGFASRFSAFSIGLIMLGAIAMVHGQHGFFMNWYGQAAGEGFEYHILALGLVAALLIKGGGKWSLDGLLAARL